METKTIQLHKGLGSGRVELKEIVNVDMGYTIRVCNPEGIETQRFVVGNPEGEEERKKLEEKGECGRCGKELEDKDQTLCDECDDEMSKEQERGEQ